MSRSYKGIRPKTNRVYSVRDVQNLYGVCRNTVSNWVCAGLKPAIGAGAQLFRGAELVRFHAERLARCRFELRYGEFKCTGCKAAVFPDASSLHFDLTRQKKTMARGSCPDCATFLMKILSDTERDLIKNCINTNTSLGQIDEVKGSVPVGIGKDGDKESREWHCENDRIIFEWQIYAGRYDAKTVDAHLISIRDFERATRGKQFDLIKPEDVNAYREALIKLVKTPADAGGKSNSTIRHRASHLSKFFNWLCMQEGYKRINKGLSEYFVLPRSATAQALPQTPKPFPSIGEAIFLANQMPVTTLFDRRNRAIFACAFVTGFRAAALSSLWLRHIDTKGKRAEHNAADIRAKNGKSYTAKWFPRTGPLRIILVDWINELQSLDARQNDALFPPATFLTTPHKFKRTNRPSIDPMRTSIAVNDAFKEASRHSRNNLSPHSARHCLVALGEELCRTAESAKAWSLNLGHSSVKVTKTHYAKVTEARKDEILEELDEIGVWTEEEKDLMLDYHDHMFHRGTPEFNRAKMLVARRAEQQ